mmetsp:Transcript_15766/g.43496  ORF Transcript_15766/g.43496 Transcript_15766/m.43496 type:complete len:83 (-) Transcript_15766:644-892(-)
MKGADGSCEVDEMIRNSYSLSPTITKHNYLCAFRWNTKLQGPQMGLSWCWPAARLAVVPTASIVAVRDSALSLAPPSHERLP